MDKNFSIYKYISSLTKSDTLPGTMYYNSECDISNTDKAHLFNCFFPQFSLEILQFLLPPHPLQAAPTLWKIYAFYQKMYMKY